MYTSVNGVGIFIRGVSGADPEEVSLRLEPHQELMMEKLSADSFGNANNNGHFMHQWEPGDCQDPADQKRLIKWLAEMSDLYETTILESLKA